MIRVGQNYKDISDFFAQGHFKLLFNPDFRLALKTLAKTENLRNFK